MNVEMSLALIKIAEMKRRGFRRQTAVITAARLVVNQGFGRNHADIVADAAASLIY